MRPQSLHLFPTVLCPSWTGPVIAPCLFIPLNLTPRMLSSLPSPHSSLQAPTPPPAPPRKLVVASGRVRLWQISERARLPRRVPHGPVALQFLTSPKHITTSSHGAPMILLRLRKGRRPLLVPTDPSYGRVQSSELGDKLASPAGWHALPWGVDPSISEEEKATLQAKGSSSSS